jgi:5S rRNA maturation endonuclease (ribonuclease M5)
MLFDYDEDGRKLAQKIGTQLEEKGVKIEHFLRKEIADLFVREGVWRIEDAYTLKGKTPY